MRWAAVMTMLWSCSGPVDGPPTDTGVGGGDGSTETASDGSGPPDIEAEPSTVVDHHPAANAQGVFRGTVIWADLSGPMPEGSTLVLTDATGETVPGDNRVFGGFRLTFAPSQRLSPSASYTATLDWGEGQLSWVFETGDRGSVAADLAEVHGIVESNVFTSVTMNVVSPPGGAVMVKAVFPLQYIEIVEGQSGAGLDVRLATGDIDAPDGGQDMCQPTLSLEAVPFDNPVMVSQPANLDHFPDLSALPLSLAGIQVTLQDLQLRVALELDEDGAWDRGVDVMLRGMVDIRHMGLGNVCNTMAGFVEGMQCEECPDDPGIRECLFIWVTDIVGPLREDVALVDRTVEDVEADPNCGP